MRFFNTAGPIKPEMHYHIDSLGRLDERRVMMLLAQQKYFILHAPRQVGKTSYMLALMNKLNSAGTHHALYINVEVGQAARENSSEALRAILNELSLNAETYLNDSYPRSIMQEALESGGSGHALNSLLTQWARHAKKPIVLLIDEIDSLVGDTLISVLRQIRAGYTQRPTAFPSNVVLCGVRDVRDYRMIDSDGKSVITGGSAFNIKAESWQIGDFNKAEIAQLYQQHTDETGQRFSDSAIDRVWALSEGQPWLVNALAYETCFRMDEGADHSVEIDAQMIEQAKENLIGRRETHLDQLSDKLKEPRVQRVIETILASNDMPPQMPEDDLAYVTDLGLIKRKPHVRIANPIYQEVIPRELTSVTQDFLVQETAWYVDRDGKLDINKLLTAFQQFFRENSEAWIERFDYKEAGPQLLLQAFLQRVINGGGTIDREYALGRKRTDLLVKWPHPNGIQRVAIELKLLHNKKRDTVLPTALAQTWAYADKSNAEDTHLILFDRRETVAWDEKISRDVIVHNTVPITVWGM